MQKILVHLLVAVVFLCTHVAAQVPNWIYRNIIWGIQGIPIFTGDKDSPTVAYHLVGPSSHPGILSKVNTDRRLNGRLLNSRHNLFISNIFQTEQPLSIEDPDNLSDDNILVADFNLASWQVRDFDEQCRALDNLFDLNSDALTLQLLKGQRFPEVPTLNWAKKDIFGNQ